MQLILTVLCRNEGDIIANMIDFHLRAGVDLILATDNGSKDDTCAILEAYQRRGSLRLLHEPTHTHDQAVWVTHMARLAAEEHGADWVIHSDADEFWWPSGGDLKAALAAAPAEAAALRVERRNFLPPPSDSDPATPFHQVQTIRERQSLNILGRPLPAKVCHRAHRSIAVSDGNHAVSLHGRPLPAHPCSGVEILHFPVRSYTQLERKIREGAEALARNTRVPPAVGCTWRHLYEQHLLPGTLPAYYAGLRPDPAALAAALERGDLVEDRRLQQALGRAAEG